jgi:hypothetical protein
MGMHFLSPAVLVIASTAYAAQMPLTVSDVVTGSKSSARLRNNGSQPVTAWSLAATTRSETGRTRREVYTVDGYLSEVTHGLPGAEEHRERLMPGQSREVPLDPLPAGATLEVVAVVLGDGTAVGDEELLAEIFAKRVKERDALKAVADGFNEVLPAKHGAEAVADLKQRFSALVQQNDAIPCRAALDAVQRFEATAETAQVDQALRTYADFVTREYELAAKHATRRRN